MRTHSATGKPSTATKQKRSAKKKTIAVVIVLVLILAGVIAAATNKSSQTPSYKDGYAYGIQDANQIISQGGGLGSISEIAQTDCTTAMGGIIPTSDSVKQFTAGCIAGFSTQYKKTGPPILYP